MFVLFMYIIINKVYCIHRRNFAFGSFSIHSVVYVAFMVVSVEAFGIMVTTHSKIGPFNKETSKLQSYVCLFLFLSYTTRNKQKPFLYYILCILE